jgi:tetratricopeptide (TPR) repeat protein
MAYVRQRGNQVAIVLGERNPETKQVEQRILFTFYSKPEAKEAMGDGAPRFRHLLEEVHPDVSFNWKSIEKGLRENLSVLPDKYEYREARLRSRFRQDLVALTRQLVLADPQRLFDAAELITEQQHALGYVADLIRWRLVTKDHATESRWTSDNPFLWRFALQGKDLPPDAEEFVEGMLERGETEKAEAAFKLLIEAFEGYADGYNALGKIRMNRGKPDEALPLFRQAVAVGRKLFPKRLAKKHCWSNISTRPYMRGLRNLALAQNALKNFDEALAACDQLESECGDADHAARLRAAVFLNAGRWEAAARNAVRLHVVDPAESLVAAFAYFELGRHDEALAHFLHGALSHPRAAKLLLGQKTSPLTSASEAMDHNAGVSLVRSLRPYLTRRTGNSSAFLSGILSDLRVASLVKERDDAARRWFGQTGKNDRTDLDRLNLMNTIEFAREKAALFSDLLERTPLAPAKAGGSRRRPTRH